jgi:hypothetical protein
MAQTVAHIVDHVIPPVPIRQWVISVPKRLRVFLADRPEAVTALTTIFLDEMERLLCEAAGVACDGNESPSVQSRLGAVSFLRRFGSALNRHVQLHACVTDGVFTATDSPDGVALLPALPTSPADIATLTERVRRRLVRWFRRRRFIDTDAASDMLAWENSGFSIDASVRIPLADRDVPGYFRSLEHLVRYRARPAFASSGLPCSRSVTADQSGSATRSSPQSRHLDRPRTHPEVIRTRRTGRHPPLSPRAARSARRLGPAATETQAPVRRRVHTQSSATPRRHVACDRQRGFSPSPAGRDPRALLRN